LWLVVYVTEDERFMRMALELAELGRGQTRPNPLVGAVIVRDGEIVGQGAHLKAGGPHAEVHALAMAGPKAKGATAYVTLEPCNHYGKTPPCSEALIEAGVRRVVIATKDPFPLVDGGGIARLRAAGVDVQTDVLVEQAMHQNETYMKWARTGLPFVWWKSAATLDGYIAADSGHSRYVTSDAARTSVQELRRAVQAIAVGIGTVLADDPRLTIRDGDSGEPADVQPIRIVFDSQLRMPATASMLTQPGTTVIYTSQRSLDALTGERLRAFNNHRVELVPVELNQGGRVSLSAALSHMGKRNIQSVVVEGGSQIVSQLFQHHLIDKVSYYLAPKLLGGGISALKGRAVSNMGEAVELERVTWSRVGPDILVEGYPIYHDELEEAGD
jgi:diaminohydroxyphosphoribosylaminopyrimidine deaminase/5-amino-6-(5-phosphoribosylamino)uracil reductase